MHKYERRTALEPGQFKIRKQTLNHEELYESTIHLVAHLHPSNKGSQAIGTVIAEKIQASQQ